MSKFDSMWHFAEKHPFIACMMLSTAVNGVVNLTKAVIRPFVKTPDCQINMGDVAKTLADAVKKPEEATAPAEEEEIVEIHSEPVLVEAE